MSQLFQTVTNHYKVYMLSYTLLLFANNIVKQLVGFLMVCNNYTIDITSIIGLQQIQHLRASTNC